MQRYAKCPLSLEHLTLADWAAWYESGGKPHINKSFGAINSKKRSKARIIRSVWYNHEKNPEKHYHELIMLFTPWRKEEKDLLANFSFYQERFLNVKDCIVEQMKLYAVYSKNLEKIQEHLNRIDDDNDNFDSLVPFTQNIEYQDEAQGLQDLHPDLNESCDLSQDVGIPSAVESSEPLILNELQDQEYRQLVQTLNQKQKEFFYDILHLVKTMDKPFPLWRSRSG